MKIHSTIQNSARIFVYPYSHAINSSSNANPYIRDFIDSLKSQNFTISNEFSKSHPLHGIIKYINNSDVFVFHWLENVILYKYGLFQFIFAWTILLILKIKKKKIVWFRHNYKPHNANNTLKRFLCRLLMNRLKSKADLIITHSKKGLEDLNRENNKSFYLIHPTKNRGILPKKVPKYDLLIWGNILKYKGVLDFLKFNFQSESLVNTKIIIIGKCLDNKLLFEINSVIKSNIVFENRPIGFDELTVLASETKFILIPYTSESILSSGILMDSLSVGANVIGPDIGAFKDLKSERLINVKTFKNFSDIHTILTEPIPDSDYAVFLNKNNWLSLASDFRQLINIII